MSNRNQLELLDVMNVLSFVISVMNYDENLTQSDKQDLSNEFSKKMDKLLGDIHLHLNSQDEKINKILEVLNEKDTNIS